MAQGQLAIGPNQRVIAVGKTRSGKSVLVRTYLAGYRNVVCLDTKGDVKWPEAGRVPVYTHLKDLGQLGAGKAIFRPKLSERSPEHYDAFFRWIFERGNTILWVDEIYSICEGQEIPFYLKALLTQGAALGIGVWICTQRPKFVPNFCFSEAEHFFVFRLNLEEDRAKVASWAGKSVMDNPPGKHGFWYVNPDMDHPVLVPQGLKFSKGA